MLGAVSRLREASRVCFGAGGGFVEGCAGHEAMLRKGVHPEIATVANVRLCSQHDSYVIAIDFWNEVVDWALDNGWTPEHEIICYRGDFKCELSDEDAANLADAIEFIAGDIVLHEFEVADDFLRHLLDTLLKLTIFFQAGGFKIIPLKEEGY